jgi:hypothetical protein
MVRVVSRCSPALAPQPPESGTLVEEGVVTAACAIATVPLCHGAASTAAHVGIVFDPAGEETGTTT